MIKSGELRHQIYLIRVRPDLTAGVIADMQSQPIPVRAAIMEENISAMPEPRGVAVGAEMQVGGQVHVHNITFKTRFIPDLTAFDRIRFRDRMYAINQVVALGPTKLDGLKLACVSRDDGSTPWE